MLCAAQNQRSFPKWATLYYIFLIDYLSEVFSGIRLIANATACSQSAYYLFFNLAKKKTGSISTFAEGHRRIAHPSAPTRHADDNWTVLITPPRRSSDKQRLQLRLM